MWKNLMYIVFLLLLVNTGCSKEDLKPDSDYTGTLVMEYSRPLFSNFKAAAEVNVNIYTSGSVVLSNQGQYPFNALDSLPGDNSIKVNETGTITISSLNGEWIVQNNAQYLSVNAYTLIEGTQIVWFRDNLETGWELTDENAIYVEDPVDTPLDFKISEAMQPNGSVLGIYEDSPYGTIVYQWTLKIEPV